MHHSDDGFRGGFQAAYRMAQELGISWDMIGPDRQDWLVALRLLATGEQEGFGLPIWDKNNPRQGAYLTKLKGGEDHEGSNPLQRMTDPFGWAYQEFFFHTFKGGLYTPDNQIEWVKDTYANPELGKYLQDLLWYPGGHWRGVKNLLVDGAPGTSKTTGFLPALVEALILHDPKLKIIVRVRTRTLANQIEAQLKASKVGRLGVRRLSTRAIATATILVATPELSAHLPLVVGKYNYVLIDDEAHDTLAQSLASTLICQSLGLAGTEANVQLVEKALLYVAMTGTPSVDLGTNLLALRGPIDRVIRATYNPYDGRPLNLIRGSVPSMLTAVEYLLTGWEPTDKVALFSAGKGLITGLCHKLSHLYPSHLLITGDNSKTAEVDAYSKACGTHPEGYPWPHFLCFNMAAAAGNNPLWGEYRLALALYDIPALIPPHQFYQAACRARGAEETYCWMTTPPRFTLPKLPSGAAESDKANLALLRELLPSASLEALSRVGLGSRLPLVHYQQETLKAVYATVSDRLVSYQFESKGWEIQASETIRAANPLIFNPPKGQLKSMVEPDADAIKRVEPLSYDRFLQVSRYLGQDKDDRVVKPEWAPRAGELIQFTKTQILGLTHEGSRLYDRLASDPKAIYRYLRYRGLTGLLPGPLELPIDLPQFPMGTRLTLSSKEPPDDGYRGLMAQRLICEMAATLPDGEGFYRLPSIHLSVGSKKATLEQVKLQLPTIGPDSRLVAYFGKEILAHCQAGLSLLRAIQRAVPYNPDTLKAWQECRLYLEIRAIVRLVEAELGRTLMGLAIYSQKELTPEYAALYKALSGSESVAFLSGTQGLYLGKERLGQFLYKSAGYVPHSFKGPRVNGKQPKLQTVLDPELRPEGDYWDSVYPDRLEPRGVNDWDDRPEPRFVPD